MTLRAGASSVHRFTTIQARRLRHWAAALPARYGWEHYGAARKKPFFSETGAIRALCGMILALIALYAWRTH